MVVSKGCCYCCIVKFCKPMLLYSVVNQRPEANTRYLITHWDTGEPCDLLHYSGTPSLSENVVATILQQFFVKGP